MRKSWGLALCGLAVVGAVWAADRNAARRSMFRDSAAGFSIDAPRFLKAGEKAGYIPVIFTAPASNGFSSNVNVMVQPQATTVADYHDKSVAEMKQANFTLLSDKTVKVSGRDALRLEFEGSTQNKKLHWLSLALFDKEQVVLITCTALADDFPKVEEEFKACLDSFQFTEKP